MASYDLLPSSAKLSDFLVAIEDGESPSDYELICNMAAVDRQTRYFLYTYLTTKFGNTTNECLQASAVNADTLANKVYGSGTATTPSIVAKSIANGDIKDGTITNDKIASKTITGASIADETILTQHLKDIDPSCITSFPTSKITGVLPKTQVGVLDSNNLGAGCVTADKVSDGVLPASKLACPSGEGYVLVSKQNNLIYPFNAVQMSGDATIDGDGKVSIPKVRRAILVEKVPIGGLTSGVQTYIRGGLTLDSSWFCHPTQGDLPIDFHSINKLFFRFATTGDYRIVANAVTFNNTLRQVVQFCVVNPSQGTVSSVVMQSPEIIGVASEHVTSHLDFGLTVTSTDTYYGLATFFISTVLATTTNSLGSNATGNTTEYASIYIERLN